MRIARLKNFMMNAEQQITGTRVDVNKISIHLKERNESTRRYAPCNSQISIAKNMTQSGYNDSMTNAIHHV